MRFFMRKFMAMAVTAASVFVAGNAAADGLAAQAKANTGNLKIIFNAV